jgi:hypothetical protein
MASDQSPLFLQPVQSFRLTISDMSLFFRCFHRPIITQSAKSPFSKPIESISKHLAISPMSHIDHTTSEPSQPSCNSHHLDQPSRTPSPVVAKLIMQGVLGTMLRSRCFHFEKCSAIPFRSDTTWKRFIYLRDLTRPKRYPATSQDHYRMDMLQHAPDFLRKYPRTTHLLALLLNVYHSRPLSL